jgi:hypothetical protein
MVALTGIEPAFGQFSSVQLGLSRCVFSPVQFATRAFRGLRMADVLPRCCPAARIRLLRSAVPLRAGYPAVLRPTLRRRVNADVGDGLPDRLPTLIVNARVERARSCHGGVHSTVWRLYGQVEPKGGSRAEERVKGKELRLWPGRRQDHKGPPSAIVASHRTVR